jgi:septum formation protein
MTTPFILASASPRREQMLREIGLRFDIVPGNVNEDFRPGEVPAEYVERVSKEKCHAVSRAMPHRWVLGADTIVVVDSEVLGKPRSRDEAREMLMKLSGRAHRVITGFAIEKKDDGVMVSGTVESTVVFKTIEEDELEWYTGTPEPYDKAGGYAVQGMGGYFVREIHGSYSNVVGLPLTEVVTVLKNVGAATFLKTGMGNGK